MATTDRRRWPWSFAIVMLLGAVLSVPVDAAEPSPQVMGVMDARVGSDVPTLTGGPVEALLAVVVIGAVTVAVTAAVQLLRLRLGQD